MNLETFFENFELLADAPNGVQKLRELILQLAVQGKLVPQDPSDEPASVLLEKIRAEKERLIKEDKIRKRVFPPINQNSLPYQVPNSWQWCYLEDIGYDLGQKKPDEKFTYIDVASINKELGFVSDDVKIVQPENAPSRARKIVDFGTVIYSTVRPYLLNVAVIDQKYNPPPIVSTAFAILYPHSGILNRYVFYYLRSKIFTNYVESEMKGMAYPAISDKTFYGGLIPLPPEREQTRIVAKVEHLMSLCDELEARKQRRDKERADLNSTLLDELLSAKNFQKCWQRICDNFDLLYDNSENLSKLRQAILQLAVRGKLVPQNPDDEPASVLLERIRAEKERLIKEKKIKRDKPLSPIEKDEIPYEIPKGWIWEKLGQFSEIVMGQSPPGTSYNESGTGIPLINGPVEFTNGDFGKTIARKFTTKPTKLCNKGDLLICVRGATTGRTNIADFDACIGRGVAAIKPFILPQYANWLIVSLRSYIFSLGTGSTFPNISYEKIVGLLCPVPPLNEQKRIVTKIDQLISLCDKADSKIRQAQSEIENIMAEAVGSLTGLKDAKVQTNLIHKSSGESISEMSDEIRRKTTLTLSEKLKQLSNDKPITIGDTMKAILSEILRKNNFQMEAKILWKASGLDIDGFYAQLKIEVNAGWIKEADPKMRKSVLEVER